jgi:hypothetical protein
LQKAIKEGVPKGLNISALVELVIMSAQKEIWGDADNVSHVLTTLENVPRTPNPNSADYPLHA